MGSEVVFQNKLKGSILLIFKKKEHKDTNPREL